MRKGRKFLIPDANSCIDCQPHKGCPRFAMNASIHLTHSLAFYSAFSMEISFTTVGFQNGQNLKPFFYILRMHKSKKLKDACTTKIIPIKLYFPLLCTIKIRM